MSERKLKPIETRALRRKEEGIFERLLCQKLISSNNADALDKIIKLAEAVFMHNGQLKDIDKTEVDMIYQIALAFKHSYPYKRRDGNEFCYMTWGFEESQANYERYITPWKQMGSLRYRTYWPQKPHWAAGHTYEVAYEEEMAEIERILALLKSDTEYQQFFGITSGHYGSRAAFPYQYFMRLRNQFVMWAIPKVQAWYASLASTIDKDIFDSVLKTMYGPRAPEREGTD